MKLEVKLAVLSTFTRRKLSVNPPFDFNEGYTHFYSDIAVLPHKVGHTIFRLCKNTEYVQTEETIIMNCSDQFFLYVIDYFSNSHNFHRFPLQDPGF